MREAAANTAAEYAARVTLLLRALRPGQPSSVSRLPYLGRGAATVLSGGGNRIVERRRRLWEPSKPGTRGFFSRQTFCLEFWSLHIGFTCIECSLRKLK